MKVVLQRVTSASVTVNNERISTIGKGILVLAGISNADTPDSCTAMARKVLACKLWDNWKSNVQDVGGDLLCVSQFTLMADTKKGTKPSFHKAAKGDAARELYDGFLGAVREQYAAEKVQDGVFGAMMDVALTNDGPVTIELSNEKSDAS